MQKEIKDAYPKKVCHMLTKHVTRRKKDAYPKKVCHMLTRHVKKRDGMYPKEKKVGESWFIKMSSYTIHPKISTHLHILIKIYDLFLLWIRFLT